MEKTSTTTHIPTQFQMKTLEIELQKHREREREEVKWFEMGVEGVNGVFIEVEMKGAWIKNNLQSRARIWRSTGIVNAGNYTKATGNWIKVSILKKSLLKGVFLQKNL